ncbi:MAG: hypothetical protein HY653_07845, partial [Acidobacteria bacterium]|nr:hypothetical protein [Acidobacteriota bacterium]
ILALVLVPLLASAYTVVLKNGQRIEAQSRSSLEQCIVKFTGTDGRAYQFPLAEVSLVATASANRSQEHSVWTNEDLERLEGGAISVLGSARAAADEGEAVEGEAGEESASQPSKEETREYWQERLAPLRAELAQIEQQLNQLRSNQGRAASNTLDLNTDAAGVDVQDTLRRLEQRRTQIQQQIEDVQAEARRKGVPAGWVR